MNDILFLSIADHMNYKALVNLAKNRVKRPSNRRRSKAARSKRSKEKDIKNQNGKCLDCGKAFNKKLTNATKEHIIPYRYGSSHSGFNIVWLCESCNSKRDENIEIIKQNIESHYGPINWDELKGNKNEE